MLLKDMVVRTEIICNPDSNFTEKEAEFNIAVGIDENYARGMGILITSILLNNTSKKIMVHIFSNKIFSSDLDRIKSLKEYKNVKIKIYFIDVEQIKHLPTTRIYSLAIYYRLIMARVLHGIVERVLYLDADILCVGSLDELSHINMGDNIILAVSDDFANSDDTIERLGLTNKKVFNSGVLFIDIDKWNNENIDQKSLLLLNENRQLYRCYDQDVLNVLLNDKVMYIDNKWNDLYNLPLMSHKLCEDTILVHYIGEKPWSRWNEYHFMSELYHNYAEKSPWENVALIEPITYKEKRRMAKSYLKKNMYIEAFKYYWEYLKERG